MKNNGKPTEAMVEKSGKFEQVLTAVLGLDVAEASLAVFWVAVTATVFGISYKAAKWILVVERLDDHGLADTAATASRWQGLLENFYSAGVSWLLRGLDRFAGEDYLDRALPHRIMDLLPGNSCAPWGAGLYKLCLRLALAYPAIALVLSWGLDGKSLQSLSSFLPEEPNSLVRAAVFPGFCFSLLCIWNWLHSRGWKRALSLATAVGTTFATAIAASLVFAPVGIIAAAFAISVALTFAIAGEGAVAGAISGSMVAFIANPDAGGVVFALAFAVAFGVANGYSWLEEKAKEYSLLGSLQIWYLFALFILANTAIFVMSSEVSHVGHSERIAVVFFVLLPLANAPIDFVSLGLTRGLLAHGQTRGRIWWIAFVSLVDILLASLAMIALVVVVVAVISVANLAAMAADGPPLLSLQGTLQLLLERPGDPSLLWVHLMLFSTFLPSALHLLIGTTGLVLALLMFLLKTPEEVVAFLNRTRNENAQKDSKITRWYPLGAAAAVTALFLLLVLAGKAIPWAVWLVTGFAKALHAWASFVASLFGAA